MKRGYYWIRFLLDEHRHPNKKWTVGFFAGSAYLPWQVVGSDDIFGADEIEIGPEVIGPSGFVIDI